MTHADRHARPAKGKPAAAAQRRTDAPTAAPGASRDAAQRLGGAYAMGPAVALRAPVQAKLTVGRAGDRYEQEADQVAERVAVGQPAGDVSRIPPGGLKAQRAEEAGDESAQPKCAACEAKQAQREEDESGGDDAQTKAETGERGEKASAQREGDESDGDAAGGTAQAKCAACEKEDAQKASEPGGAEEDTQRESEDAESAQRAEEEDGGDTQRSEEEGGEDAQRAESETDESAQAMDAADSEPVQRQEEGESEEGEAEEDHEESEGGDEDASARECDEAGAGGGAAAGGGAREDGEEAAEGGGAEESAEEGAEEEGAEEEGAEGPEGGAAEGGGGAEALGCGEEGEGGGEEAAAAPGAGGHSCGGGAETTEEGGEGGGEGAEGGETAAAEEGPAPAEGAVPSCATAMDAAPESEGSSESAGGGGAAGSGAAGEAAASGECATAQRKEDEADEGAGQRSRGSADRPAREGPRRGLDTGTASRMMHARGAGESLAPTVRKRIEGSVGVDLGGVRVHADGASQTAARALRAKAFTHRNHIFLGAGQSPHDVNLMAHESAHVLQQGAVARRKPESSEPAIPRAPEASHAVSEGSSQESARHAAAAPVREGAPPTREAGRPAGGASAGTPSGAAPPPASPDPVSDGVGSGGVGPGGTAPAPPPSAGHPSKTAPPGKAGPAAGPAATPRGGSGGEPAAAGGTEPAPRAGGVAVVSPDPTAFDGEPSASLTALGAVSPVRAPFIFRLFAGGVRGALDRRRGGEQRDRPRARIRPRAPQLPTGRPGAPARGGGPTVAALSELDGDTPAADVPVAAAISGAAPVVDATEQERGIDQIDEGTPSVLERVRAWLGDFFARVPTSDEHVNTDPGPATPVTLIGRSDPSQIDGFQAEASGEVARGLTDADEARAEDFGEYDVEPDAEDEEPQIPVPESIHHMGPGCDAEDQAEPLAFDPEHEAELGERVGRQTGPRFAAEAARMASAEQERDRTISLRRGQLPGQVAGAHADAYQREDAAARAARAEVASLRGRWGTENLAVQTEFEGTSQESASGSRGAITARVASEQEAVTNRFDTTRTEAETRRTTLAADTEREREQARRESSSGSWVGRGLRWLKNKARSLLRALARKIKQWFNELRAWVRRKFDELKQWALRQIERVRRWAIEKLENLRRTLKGMADRYLSRFPGLRDRFKAAIDTTIDFAQAGVNAAANNLKKAVVFYIDSLATIVDTSLAVAERVVVGGLEIACELMVLGFNLTIVFVDGDLESLIELVRELPEQPPLGGPLMSMVKAGILGFLERLRDKPADQKKRYVEKTRWLVVSPAYYGGALLGILKGIVWDGLVGTIRMVYDIIVGLPKAIADIYNFVKTLLTDVEAIEQIASAIEATREEVRAFLARPDAADQVIAFLQRSPQALIALVQEAMRQGREFAYRAGAGAADQLFTWVLKSSHFQIGLAVGTFIGQIIFEALLLYFTAGAGTAIKIGGKALQWLAKGLRMLVSGLQKGGGLIMRALSGLRSVAMAGLRMAQRLGGALRRIFQKLTQVVERVFAWFRRQFARIRRKKGGRPDPHSAERRVFRAFKLRVNAALQPFRRRGIAHRPLTSLLARERRVAGTARVVFRTIVRKALRLRYRITAVVRYTAVPQRVGTVARLPTGQTRGEAIPFVWYKPISLYQPVTLSARNPNSARDWDTVPVAHPASAASLGLTAVPVPRRQQQSAGPFAGRPTVTLGIRPNFVPLVGKRMKRVRSGGTLARAGRTANALITLFNNFGHNLASRGEQIEHIQDIGYSGSDTVGNLWPLDGTLNQNAKTETNQRQRVLYQQGNDDRQGVPNSMIGRWFRIRRTQRP